MSESINEECCRNVFASFYWKVDNYLAKARTATSKSLLVSPVLTVMDTAWPDHPKEYHFDMSLYKKGQTTFLAVRSLSANVPVKFEDFTWFHEDENSEYRFGGDLYGDSRGETHQDKELRQYSYFMCEIDTEKFEKRLSGTPTFFVDVVVRVNPFRTDPVPILDIPYDLTLKCGNESFECHKAILAAHSGAFEEMFSLSSDNAKELPIPEVKPLLIKEMLDFIYFNRLDPTYVRDLYILADKFDLFRMKKQLMCALTESLTVDNVVDILVLLEAYGCEEEGITRNAYWFADANVDEVKKTSAWEEAVRSNSTVVKKLIEKDFEDGIFWWD